MTTVKPFLCDQIDKSNLRDEWTKWLRSFELYLISEEINEVVKKKNKLLHLGGSQLQEVIFSLPGALVDDVTEEANNAYKILVEKLNCHFSPSRNSTFERHLFRCLKPAPDEDFNKFLLRVRKQAAKCTFGATEQEAQENYIKDKIIDCCASVELKRKFLEKEQSLSEVIDLCHVHQQTSDQSQMMRSPPVISDSSPLSVPTSSTVNQIVRRSAPFRANYADNNECQRCGSATHESNDLKCPARSMKCNKCGLIGHFARRCKTRAKKRSAGASNNRSFDTKRRKTVNLVNDIDHYSDDDDHEQIRKFDCFNVRCDTTSETDDEIINCHVGNVPITMLIDSGSKVNIITTSDWNKLTKNKSTMWNISDSSSTRLSAFTGCPMKIVKEFAAGIRIGNAAEIIATFYFVDSNGISLLGKDTAIALQVLKLGPSASVNAVIENKQPFSKIKGITVKLSIDRTIKPIQQPVRRIPVAYEEKVENKLLEALKNDIIEQVNGPSPWISPIVIIFKSNGDMRICVDMRRANEAILRENFPLPSFDTFLTKLRGAQYFSRLDLKNAYHQLELDEQSREITTFITHKGMFRYKRLMFGVNSAPEIFQRIFESILAPCSNCLNYIDDIIVFGRDEKEHDISLKNVLQILKDNNVVLNDSKCLYKVQQLKFLGHNLSQNGIDPDADKVNTIKNFRTPSTKEETRSFLGLVTYVGKFIPDLANTTEPLRQLTKNDEEFVWTSKRQAAFEKLKSDLSTLPTLAYFDPKNRTRLIADASPVALGAVLIQFKLNEPYVISYASKSLSSVEKRYSQTEKESLALVWSVERFYYYLAGLEFELVTDHKPLEAIFKPTSKPPARIERWVLRLQAFKFKVIYQAGKFNIADSVSRLCQLKNSESFDELNEQHVFHIIEKSIPVALQISDVVVAGRHDDEILNAIEKSKNNSWHNNDDNVYYLFRHELSTVGNVLLRGDKLVIPSSLRQQVLQLAHEGHPGESVMKRRVRSKVWWPLIDRQVEKYVKNCRDCLVVSQPNRPPPMARKQLPPGPWKEVAIDLLGPLPNHDFVFVIIDYYSRYQEMKFVKTITSSVIIRLLSELFSRLGIPKSIRADNGRQFVSEEFKLFCKQNGIQLTNTPPYWPQANGEVENMNRSIVKRLKISHENNRNYKEDLEAFSLMYNVTPHSVTGKSPSELMFGRNIRDKIPTVQDLVETLPDEEVVDEDRLKKQIGKRREDVARGAKEPFIKVGDKVLVKNVIHHNKLTPNFDSIEYEVLDIIGTEVIVRGNGKEFRRNISHLKKIPSSVDLLEVFILFIKLPKLLELYLHIFILGSIARHSNIKRCSRYIGAWRTIGRTVEAKKKGRDVATRN